MAGLISTAMYREGWKATSQVWKATSQKINLSNVLFHIIDLILSREKNAQSFVEKYFFN